MEWFIKNVEKILNIIKAILNLLEELVAEDGAPKVAERIVGLLKKALPIMLGLIGGLLGIPDLGSVIRGWADALLEKAGQLLLKLFKKLLSLVGLGGGQAGAGAPKPCPMGCWTIDTRAADEEGRQVPWIEILPFNCRAVTISKGDCDQGPAVEDLARNASDYRIISLRLEHDDPTDYVEAKLGRHVSWLQELGAQVGGRVYIDMREMGLCGWALVEAIDPCPAIKRGKGRLVTGWFRHSRAVVYELQIEGQGKPLVGTGNHPCWSLDRWGWVALRELQAGERMLGHRGPVRVGSVMSRVKEEPVYNIEVEGDHCYRVGEQGLLVHNSSAHPGIKELTPPTSATVYKAEDCTDPTFYIFGTVGSGVLKFEVVTKTSTKSSNIRGEDFFNAMMDHFGSSVKIIEGNWDDTNPERTSNLDYFNKATGSSNISLEQAALVAPRTGQWADGRGYTKVKFITLDPNDTARGKFTKVVVQYSM